MVHAVISNTFKPGHEHLLIPQKNYHWIRNNPTLLAEAAKMVAKWEASGICEEISPSDVHHTSSILLIEKETISKNVKEYRLCLDLKELNKHTIINYYPIPTLAGEFHKFVNCHYITN